MQPIHLRVIQEEVELIQKEQKAEEPRVQIQDLMKDLLLMGEVMIMGQTDRLPQEVLLIRDPAEAVAQVAIWDHQDHHQAVAEDLPAEAPDPVVADPEEAEVNKIILITDYF